MSSALPDHQNLFNARLIQRASSAEPVPPGHQRVLSDWANTIRSGSIRRHKEQQIRSAFVQKIFGDVLGYTTFGGSGPYTLADENYVGKGRVDVVLGHFGNAANGKADQVLVPLELKGPDTPNLDVMMSGRFKSPVQQVWEYAMDVPHAKFLLLTNMLEIRLYAVGHTRRVYERFDLLEVADAPDHYHRLQLLLGVGNLLGGRTLELLNESGQIEKQITDQLYADYKLWRIQLINALVKANQIALGALIAPVQKLLDRVLFVAFAQQRGLLPAGTLKSVHTETGWARLPVWDHYKTLFRAVDKGLPERRVPPYNGGLFAPDALLDNLTVPDAACEVFQEFAKYDLGGEVSVNVLGHIFEQSISDLEELQALAETGTWTPESLTAQAQRASASTAVSGARKEGGIVYTPEFITAFMVEQTLGKTLDERRSACMRAYRVDQSGEPEWRKPTAEEKRYAKALVQKDRVVELLFWRAWLTELTSIKICDPACGSGAFLVAAFDVLRAEYTNVNEQITAITGSMDVFNADKEILNGNLYGVDLNAESIEITKLSLWLKTARYGKPLESLEAHLRIGNSLIAPADGGLGVAAKAFDWGSAFPEVTAQGGFDVVLGNPPYVRMELLKPIKPYLEQHYAVASDRADLYCYFFELGLRLLRPECGRMGFISSSTFFKTGSGEKLRQHLLAHAQLETVVDFGDLQVFDGVTTYPAIVTLLRTVKPQAEVSLQYWKVQTAIPVKFKESFLRLAQPMPQNRLTAQPWQFEGEAMSGLRHKLTQGHRTLKEVYGAPCRGVVSGLNEAFVLTRAQRDALIQQDPHSTQLLKPFLEGKDLKKWRVESQDLWLIYIPKNKIKIDDYPAIKAHLLPFKEALEKRATKQAWFELQQAQEAYAPAMGAPKLVYVDMSDKPNFSIDHSGSVLANTGYFVASGDGFLLALMTSRALWFLLTAMTTAYRGGFYRLFTQHVETLPIPEATQAQKDKLTQLAKCAQTAAETRRDVIAQFNHAALRDFAPAGGKLPAAWQVEVPTFAVFVAELKKRFKRELVLRERNDWDGHITQVSQRVNALTQTITSTEREIDTLVNTLFGLTASEAALLSAG